MILWQWHVGIPGAGKRPKAGRVPGNRCSNPEAGTFSGRAVVDPELVQNRAFKESLAHAGNVSSHNNPR